MPAKAGSIDPAARAGARRPSARQSCAVLQEISMKTAYQHLPVYETKDGSLIRELMHPGVHQNRNQSLAEAVIEPGARTVLHRHRVSEELYHVTRGEGRMTLGAELLELRRGDTVCIAPGMPHFVENTGAEPLHILCCCAPAYSHADTELLETAAHGSAAPIPSVPRPVPQQRRT
jgi:mannose-6-phosphate isomerase-like protein (cupin superfamily)